MVIWLIVLIFLLLNYVYFILFFKEKKVKNHCHYNLNGLLCLFFLQANSSSNKIIIIISHNLVLKDLNKVNTTSDEQKCDISHDTYFKILAEKVVLLQ